MVTSEVANTTTLPCTRLTGRGTCASELINKEKSLKINISEISQFTHFCGVAFATILACIRMSALSGIHLSPVWMLLDLIFPLFLPFCFWVGL